MVRLRSNRRTSAENHQGKQQVDEKGGDNDGEDLESLLQAAVKNLTTTKAKASTKVTPSKAGEETNNEDHPSQPLFIQDAYILDTSSLHSGLREDFRKRRTGIYWPWLSQIHHH